MQQKQYKYKQTIKSGWRIAYKAANTHPYTDQILKSNKNPLLVSLNKTPILKDDAGEMQTCYWGAHFNGNRYLLQHSLASYRKLKQLNTPTAIHFHRFLPENVTLNGQMEAKWLNRSFSLSGRQLTQKQLKWVLLRLFEFAAWMAKEGYVHAGLTPESIWIVPKTHGIVIGSFYHLTKKGMPLKTMSKKYQNWYPSDVLEHKMASSQIDIEMIKNMAIYLLGAKDHFGVNKGMQPFEPAWTDFIMTFHHNAYQCLKDYRKLIRN